MFKINKILVLFMMVMLTLFVGIWEIMHSRYVKDQALGLINKYTQKELSIKVDIEKLDFNLFPIKLKMSGVKVIKDLGFETYVNKVELEFNLFDSLKTKFTIDKIIIEDGSLDYTLDSSTSDVPMPSAEKIKEMIKKSVKTVIKKSDTLPIGFNYIIVKDFTTKLDDAPFTVRYLDLSVDNKNIKTNLRLQNINVGQWIDARESVDQVQLSLWVSQKQIQIKSLKINDEFNKLNLRGKLQDYLGSEPLLSMQGSAQSDVSVINEYVDLSKIGEVNKGQVSVAFDTKGPLSNLKTRVKLSLSDLISQFANAQKAQMEITVDNSEVRVEKFSLNNYEELIELKKPFQFFDFKSKKFIEQNILVQAKRVKLNNALRYLRKNLKVLKGEVTGNVEFILNENSFEFWALESTKVDDVKLVIDENEILHVPELVLSEKALFGVYESVFKMDLPGQIKDNKFRATGLIKEKEIDFKIIDGKVNLNDWGPIAGLEIKGEGVFSFFTEIEDEKSNLIVDSKLSNFSIMDYRLDEVSSKTIIDVSDSELFVDVRQALNGKLSANGNLVLYLKNKTLDSNLDFETSNLGDIKDVLHPLIGNLTTLPENIWGSWSGHSRVYGGLSPDALIVETSLKGKNNFIFDEAFSSINLDLKIKNKVLSFNNIDVTKLRGKILGDVSLELDSLDYKYDLSVTSLPLSEITNYTKLPFGLNANLDAKFTKKDFRGDRSSGYASLTNSKIENRAVSNSSLIYSQKGARYETKFNFLGDQLVLSSNVDLGSKMQSELSLDINSTNFDELIGITKFVDINNLDMQGKVKVKLQSKFDKLNILKGNHNLNIQELKLIKDDLKIDYNNLADNIIIKNGQVQKWDLNYLGADFSITSEVSGNFLSSYVVESRFKLNAKILELFNTVVGTSSGVLRGKVSVDKNFDVSDIRILAFSNNLKFDSPQIPVDIDKAQFEINYSNEKLMIKKMNAQLSKGSVDLSGTISFKDIFPNVNMKYKLNSAGLPIKNKSEFVLSGDGILIGNRFPYNLSGNLSVDKFSIRNEFAEFIENDSVAFKKDYDYLPNSRNKYANRFVNFNLNVDIPNTITVKNSLVSMKMGGELVLSGGESDMKLLGDLRLASGYNFATFKNNEFVFKKLSVSFQENRKIHNPDLDIVVTSNIEKYKINAKVLGPVNSFNVNLAAEPFLTKESILSLIAFGYTEDLSTNLNDKEREAMTQAGVGSILFDSFKINETLKDELGLEINLGSEITREEGSYLAGRASSDNDVGRVRSATTVEIRKTITDEMNLSVSSTIGGSVGQRQSMNLNYNINKKLSLEGIYESRSTTEGQSINTGNSLGADLKLRWSFK